MENPLFLTTFDRILDRFQSCTCGNEKTVIAKYLKNRAVKSCGCLKKEQLASKAKDYTGKRFGMLKVLAPTEHRDKSGSVLWLCRCDCGNTIEVSQPALANGNKTSCGCAWEYNKKHINERINAEDGTSTVLLKNRKYRKDNKSGFRGVSKSEDDKYRVFIGFKGKKYTLGTYKNYSDAVDKRLEAEKLLFEGYIHSKEDWNRKEPLVFDVSKEGNVLTVRSNDTSMDGKSMICCKEETSENKSSAFYHRKASRKRIYNRHSYHHNKKTVLTGS